MKRRAVLLTSLFLLLAGAFAQAQQSDLSANVFGAFTNTVNGKGLTESATNSAGFLFSYRHFGQGHGGVEVSYSFTKNSQTLNVPIEVQTHVHELTGDYVFRVTRGKVQPFALAGGGLLLFRPTHPALVSAFEPTPQGQTRPAFLYGFGMDYRLRKSLAIRAQYRGFVYESPDLFGDNYALHTSTAMQMREPTIGIVWKF